MATINQVKVTRDKYLQDIEELELFLGSPDVIGYIQDQSPENRRKFFDLKSELAITRSKLRRAILDQIAFKLEALENQFKDGVKNINSELDTLRNTNDILAALDSLLGILARVFV
jgi:hypothetical protein